jgi:hypothetical protein
MSLFNIFRISLEAGIFSPLRVYAFSAMVRKKAATVGAPW